MLVRDTAMTQRLRDTTIGKLWIKYQSRAWFIPSITVGFCLIVAIMVDTHDKTAAAKGFSTPYAGIDTFIPNGYVLLPIDVQNLESLDSLLGQYGVVDLYTPGDPVAVAKGLKIIRSPKDPSEFSVLVPESQSAALVRAEDKPFLVVVQNPSKAADEVRSLPIQSRIVIEN